MSEASSSTTASQLAEENYKPARQETLTDILSKDNEDESLKRYKQQLLGAAASGGVSRTDDPRLVVIKTFGVVFPNKEHEPIIRDVDTPQKADELKKNPIVVKEGVDCVFQVTFKVQHDIVSALRFENQIKKSLITVDKMNFMMGSYGPRDEPYVFKSQAFTAPSGMLARGKYNCNTKFVDDDKKNHLDLNYTLAISKDFSSADE